MHRSHLEKNDVLQMLSHSTNRVIFLEAPDKRPLNFSLPALVLLNKSTQSKAKSYSYEISTHEILMMLILLICGLNLMLE